MLRGPLRRLVLVVVLAAVGAVAAATGATAVPPGCSLVEVVIGPGETVSRVECPEDEDEGTPEDSGSSEPTCEKRAPSNYCIGESVCWANIPSALPESRWPEETRPSPEAIYTYQSCSPDPTGELTGWSWYEPEEPSLADQAREAFGRLRTPGFEVGFNPPGRAIVGLETWFWAQGPADGRITGSSAMGVVAIGEPRSLEVDPGDGSGVLTCGWSTDEDDGCSYVYERSSARGQAVVDGQPAYTARMRLVYDVRFEDGGAPLSLPGLPTTLPSPWVTTGIPVAEIQSIGGNA